MTVEEGGSKAIDEAIVKVASELYADLAKPAARRTGTAIDSLFKVGLSPVAILKSIVARHPTLLLCKQ